jgi:hypothetical protein
MAIQSLRDSDDYIGALIGEASLRAPGDRLRLVTTAIVLFAAGASVILAINWMIGPEPRRDEATFYVWLTALVCAAGYVIARWIFGVDTVDGVIGRVVDAVTGQTKRPPDRF